MSYKTYNTFVTKKKYLINLTFLLLSNINSTKNQKFHEKKD